MRRREGSRRFNPKRLAEAIHRVVEAVEDILVAAGLVKLLMVYVIALRVPHLES